MPNGKGTLIASARRYVEEVHGEEAWAKLARTLPKHVADLAAAPSLVGMYPLAPVFELHRLIDKALGKGDLGLVRDIGRFGATWQLNAFHKMFLKFTSPLWVLERGSRFYKQYYDTGELEFAKTGDKQVRGVLRDLDFTDPAFCARMTGFFQRCAELSGGKNVVVRETQCRARGAATCTFDGSWE